MTEERRRRSPEEFVNAITSAVSERLSTFGLEIDPTEAATIIARWAEKVADEHTFERSSVLYATENDISEIADNLVSQLLGDIAEERPGTDPWDHEATIPVPMSFLLIEQTYLATCATLALRNDADKWARHAIACIGQISEAILEATTRETPPPVTVMEILLRGEMRPVRGQAIFIPQPAAAYIARFYENVAFHVERGLWDLHDPSDAEEREATLETLTTHAEMLRDLNARFGRKPGPRRDS